MVETLSLLAGNMYLSTSRKSYSPIDCARCILSVNCGTAFCVLM